MITSMSSLSASPLVHPDAWEDPLLFDESETYDIPAKLLPGALGQFAAALANSTETPEALSVMTVLGVISTALAKRFVISPKEGWHEAINIYTLIALPPANHKSLVLSTCTKPLVEWEKTQANQLDGSIKRQISERKTQEKIIEGLRIKAAKAKDSLEQRNLIEEIANKEAAPSEIATLPVLFINDATPESLTTIIHEQKGRLGIFSDEGGILETLSGLYSNGIANVDILLKGIDGGEVRVRRKDRSITVNPSLTIVLTVQPSVIQNMADKRAFLGNGTLERFLYVLPKSKLGYRTHDKPPLPAELESAYGDKIKDLLNTFANADNGRIQEPQTLILSPTALTDWRDFQSYIEEELRPEGKFAFCQGWAGKICGFALRIAGLLHVAERGSASLTISDSTMANALQITTLLTYHAIAAFGLMGIDQATQDAKTLYQWLKSLNKPSFTQSEILLAMRNKKLGKADRLFKAISILRERNLISSPIKLSTTRKPTTLYHINPALISSTTRCDSE